MRIGHVKQSLPQYYDRDYSNALIRYTTGGVAPHAWTIVASYTVPTTLRAMWDVGFLMLRRDGTPTTAGLVYADFFYTPAGYGGYVLAEVQHYSALLNSHETVGPFHGGVLRSGDKIEVATADLSTGGTMYYACTTKVFEFL